MSIERVHGLHAVQSVLARHAGRVRRVYIARDRDDARITKIIAAAAATAIAVERVDAVQLTRLCGEGVHQGVIAEIEPLPAWDEDQLLQALSATGAVPPLVLVLDGVQDPHNLGACLRTADACGALAVVTPKDRAAPLTATARKVAAGAAETTPVVRVTNLARCLRDLKSAGLWIVGTDSEASQPADAVDLRGPIAVVMGAEGAGLRHNTRQHCDWLIRLPSLGAVESLNVSVATGMVLYEALRQRGTR